MANPPLSGRQKEARRDCSDVRGRQENNLQKVKTIQSVEKVVDKQCGKWYSNNMSYSNWEPDPSKRAGTLRGAFPNLVVENLGTFNDETINALIDHAPSGQEIADECLDIMRMLLKKNISYGNSALDPVQVFSQTTAEEQIKIRIDDKINRIKNQQEFESEDTVQDLIGYLVLLKIARERARTNQEA